MRITSLFVFAVVVAIGVIAAPPQGEAFGAVIPFLTAGPSSIMGPHSDSITFGYGFEVFNTTPVIALGVWDKDSDGFGEAHTVGIFKASDQSLLGSVTFAVGTEGYVIGSYRYKDLGATISLSPGTSYMIAVNYNTVSDSWGDCTNSTSDVNLPDASIGGWDWYAPATNPASYRAGNTVLVYPIDNGTYHDGKSGYIVANFLVPEPATMALMALGGLGLLLQRRRR